MFNFVDSELRFWIVVAIVAIVVMLVSFIKDRRKPKEMPTLGEFRDKMRKAGMF